MKILSRLILLCLLFAAGAVIFVGIGADGNAPDEARRHYIDRGREETGAVNLVSAIYLGYRAFDTLGETVVLLLGVSGVVFLMVSEERR